METEVINTGTELLLGQVTNTHVGYFGERLFELGLRISRQDAIPDGDAIKVSLAEAITRSELVLVTGGLGPTPDDITRELTAEMLGLELAEDESVVAEIAARFERSGKTMGEINRRQAMVPRGAEVLANPHGTAPGLYIRKGAGGSGAHIFLLPGPPRELKPMYEAEVLPRLRSLLDSEPGSIPVCRNHFFMGLGESELACKLEPKLGEHLDKFELGYCLKAGGIFVRCIGAAEIVDPLAETIRSASVEGYVGEGITSLESAVVGALAECGETVATAESCTGGQIAARITDVPGSSGVFGYGFVTYANSAKHELLGVSEELLESHGAVSEPVARAMVEGALAKSGADHAIAVTGIAGPGGGSAEKPVGTVWIALSSRKGDTIASRRLFPTDRAHFKERTTNAALDMLRRRIAGIG